MKRNLILFSFSMMVIFSMLAGFTASSAQALTPAAQPQDDPPVPFLRQANPSGFGNPLNAGIFSLEIFSDQLYATSGNWQIGAQVWRKETGGSWTAVSEPGFGIAYGNKNPAITDMFVFNGNLYASTAWGGSPAQVWRTSNGTTWNQMVADGFGNSNNFGITTFGILDGFIYAGTLNTTNGSEIWRSDTGDLGGWVKVVADGNGNINNYIITSLTEFGGYLYAAVENTTDGAQIWRTNDGLIWTVVGSGGFGDADNTQTGGMTIFGGYLYVGTRNDVTGAQLFRSANGTTWVPMIVNGFGDVNNFKIEMIYAWNGNLYAGTDSNTGVELWQSPDGLSWNQTNFDGFDDSNNIAILWNSTTIEYHQRLYIGTENSVNGGEIWTLFIGYPFYLPVVVR